MPSLREVQQAVQRSVLLHEDPVAAAYIVDEGVAPAERLSIYRNTFAGSLTTALRLSFPAVYRLVGAEFFTAAARIFVHEQPPRSAYLDEYGAGVPAFLARFPPAASLAYLPDVARLEWAVSRALHAPDVEPLDVARLSDIDPADHGRVRFVPHPSVSLLRVDYPADAIWRAVLVQDDAALAAIDLAKRPLWLIVQRSPSGIEVTRSDETASRFAGRLLAGQPLEAALDAVDGADAPSLLAEHLRAGRFVAFSIGDAPAPPPVPQSPK
jgi:hypothetical protein